MKPYLELLHLINDLGSLSKIEIAIFFLQLTNYQRFNIVKEKILKFRKESKNFKGSRKMYVKECFIKEIHSIYAKEIKTKKYKTRESTDDSLKKFIATKTSNMKDYADAFVRYIRATELVTFQRKTLRLIASPQKKNELDYILKNIPREPKKFSTEKDFKNYLFNPNSILLLNDNKALLLKQIKTLGISELDESLSIEELKDILDELSQKIKIKNINEQKQEIKSYKILPEILAVFQKIKKKEIADASLFLEWNVWRALVMLNYALRIDGNFIMDIDGMPLNYAPGNKPDIVSEFENFCLVTEVTMSSGHTQYRMENESVPRHFGKTKEAVQKETYCIFIAPKISEGTLAHYFNLNKMKTKLYGGKTKIIPLTITQFINFIEIGVDNKFDNPRKLKDWLETQWKNNQVLADEEIWYKSIENNLPTWLET